MNQKKESFGSLNAKRRFRRTDPISLRTDPQQLHNLADSPEYKAVLEKLSGQLMTVLQETRDPRLDDAFDRSPYIEVDQGKPAGAHVE